MKKAAKTRPRAIGQQFRAGDVVYVWRNKVVKERKYRGWVGPGMVVCVNEKNTSAYISMRGVVVKTNTDRMRLATDHEYHGAELIKLLSKDSLSSIGSRGQRGYVDATHEDGPEDDEQFESPPDHDAIVEATTRPPLSVIPEEELSDDLSSLQV